MAYPDYKAARLQTIKEISSLGHEAYWDSLQLKTKAGTPIDIIIDRHGNKQYTFVNSQGKKYAFSSNGKFIPVVSKSLEEWNKVDKKRADTSRLKKEDNKSWWLKLGPYVAPGQITGIVETALQASNIPYKLVNGKYALPTALQTKDAKNALTIGSIAAPIATVAGAVLPAVAPGTIGGNIIGDIAGWEAVNKTSDLLTGKTFGGHIRSGIGLIPGANEFLYSSSYLSTPYEMFTDIVGNPMSYNTVRTAVGKGISSLENAAPTIKLNFLNNLQIGNWRYRLPTGKGVYLRLGNRGIIDDAINTGIVGPESLRSNSIRRVNRWKSQSKSPGDEYDLAYLKGIKWLLENPNATEDEISIYIHEISPGLELNKHFSSHYMFNAEKPFYGLRDKYKYTIIGSDRPEISWRTVRHKRHKNIREPYVSGAENTMGVPTEYMDGYYTLLPFGMGEWFRRFPDVKAPKEYYKPTSWTPLQWDDAYNAAVQSGNMDKVLRLRDLHFKVNFPNTLLSSTYYRSERGGVPWNIFNITRAGTNGDRMGKGIYFFNNFDAVTNYGNDIRNFYINAENVGEYSGGPRLFGTGLELKMLNSKIPVMRKAAQESYGKDAMHGIDTSWGEGLDEFVIRNPNQVKLADPITYDDAGNIIPLSLRDNPLSPDIRYSWMPWLLGGGIGTNFLLNNGTSGNKTN